MKAIDLVTYDLEYKTEVDVPHPVWLKPYAGGKPRAFFIPSIAYGRNFIDLVTRMDTDYEVVTIDRNWDNNKWGFGDFYDLRGAINDFGVMYENLEKVLCSDIHFDVLVLPGVNGWAHFTDKTVAAIEKRVREGAGLVLIKPFHGVEDKRVEVLDKMSPLYSLQQELIDPESGYPARKSKINVHTDAWIIDEHPITHGFPKDIIPFDELGYYEYQAEGNVFIRSESGWPIAATKEYGKGRVVAFGYVPKDFTPEYNNPVSGSCFESAGSEFDKPNAELNFDYLEYFYMLTAKAIYWACRREPAVQLAGMKQEGDSLRLSASEKGEYRYAYQVKTVFDSIVAQGTSDDGVIRLPDWVAFGGQFRCEVKLLDQKGAVIDCAVYPFSRALVTTIEDVTVSRDIAMVGEEVTCTVSLSGKPADVVVEVYDGLGRLLETQRFVQASDSVTYTHKAGPMLSINLYFRATVVIDGHDVAKYDSKNVLITPQKRTIDDFEVFMAAIHRGRRDFSAMMRERYQGVGITGLYPGDSKYATSCGAKGLGVYWYHRKEYCQRKNMYIETGDKKWLHRKPCLNDPAFWQENGANITKTVAQKKDFGPVSYFANDEGSLTCYTDALDLCFCPHCLAGFREWLKQQYASVEALNEAWGTAFATWEDVVPYTYYEAKKTGIYSPWGAHRIFMEKTFAGAYEKIKGFIRAQDPLGRIRMSGCQASTAYSGYDYYQLHQHVGYFEAYGSGNQMEFHRSFRQGDTIIGGWTGYGVSGQNARHAVWSGLFHGLSLFSLFWQYAILNPDYTYSQSAKDLGSVFKEVRREGLGKLLLYTAKRDHLGIAVHYSMPSIHGSYLRDDEHRFNENREGWIHLLEDMGYQYNFLATQQIEAGALDNGEYKVLIMPYSIALTDKEVEKIRAFAAAGGMVIGDAQTGVMDAFCKLSDQGSLDDVFGVRRSNNDNRPFNAGDGLVVTPGFDFFDAKLQNEYEIGLAEIAVREGTGKAAYTESYMNTVKGFIVNRFQKGYGVYLNSWIGPRYAGARKGGGGATLRRIMGQILARGGVEKFATLTDTQGKLLDNGYETIYYSQPGDVRFVGVLRGFEDKSVQGHDGLRVGPGNEQTGVADTAVLNFPRKAHAYNMRTGQYMGYTDRVETGIAPSDAALFALLPFEVEGVSGQAPAQVKPGDKAEVTAAVLGRLPADYQPVVCYVNGKYHGIYDLREKIDED
nr:beta-galactosidase [bacterium]